MYQDDFNWVKQNTKKDAIFMAGGQCLSYNLNRFAYQSSLSNLDKADYVWVNQNFNLDNLAILDEDIIQEIDSENIKEVYTNSKTGTKVYKIN